MLKFKFYNKNLKKFVAPHAGPEKVWEIRYSLGLWNDSFLLQSVRIVNKLTKQDKIFDLYIKHNNKYELYTTKIGNELINTKKLKEDEAKILINIKKEKEWRKKVIKKQKEKEKKKKEKKKKK